jgi:hypothetical protein
MRCAHESEERPPKGGQGRALIHHFNFADLRRMSVSDWYCAEVGTVNSR